MNHDYQKIIKQMQNPKYRRFSRKMRELSDKLNAAEDKLEVIALMEESEFLMQEAMEESRNLYDMLVSASLGIRERGMKKLTGASIIID